MILSKGTALVALSLTLGGCNNLLDLQDPAAVNETQVWNDSALADAYVNRIYADNLPGWTTGDATTSDESPGGTDQLYGQLTASSVDYWPYGPIRRINILLANIDRGTLDTARTKQMKGEAYFFRAWRYWEMVKRYGGVPLALVAQNLTDSLNLPRSPTSVCMTQILSDLDQAIALLPQISVGAANDGHLHKGTALALKGRVLLYYASPQFNRPTPDMQRWQTAYDANLAARDYLAAHGFGLYPSFEQLWFVDMNPEAIFVRRYSYPVSTHNWQAATRPLDESQNATGANR
ncbi:MAG TPA: RagB/SusD family nutrient uptake outer membrane protein, partial [Gemmatimonadales bacterium]